VKHVVLKETNLTLSRVGFGCGPLGSKEWGNYDQKETMSAVSKAFELGINYFDTADVYGLGTSEELLSKALGNNRHEAVISTKFGVNWSSNNKELRAETFYDLSPGRVKEALEESLRRLRIDSVPLYFMHWPDPKTPLQETLEVLESLISQGKVQYIGLSNFSLKQIKEVNQNLKVSAIQVQHSLIDQDLSTELVDYCKVNNINLLSYGSLAQGLLSGKYDKHFEFNEDDCRNRLPHFHGETLEKHIPLIRKIKSIALKYKVSSSQVALRWALEEPMISSVISGIKTINQLEDNYGCLDWEIDESDYDFFKRTQ
jgi:aryl-alcohol dehydrogenase-like predicted oxidoreductase